AEVVAIGLRLGRPIEVDDPLVPSRNLQALVTQPGEPAGDAQELIVRRLIVHELREKHGGTFDLGHGGGRWFVGGGWSSLVDSRNRGLGDLLPLSALRFR